MTTSTQPYAPNTPHDLHAEAEEGAEDKQQAGSSQVHKVMGNQDQIFEKCAIFTEYTRDRIPKEVNTNFF